MEISNKKGANMNNEDRVLLINLIRRYKNVVDNTKTDLVSCKEKNDVWEKICFEFNSMTTYRRSVTQLRITYKNMKRHLKHQNLALDDDVNIFKTEDGTTFKKEVSEDDNLLTPLCNPFDSSAEYYGDDVTAYDADKSIKQAKDELVENAATSWSPSISLTPTASVNTARCTNSATPILTGTSANSPTSTLAPTTVPMSISQEEPIPPVFKRNRKGTGLKSDHIRRRRNVYNEANVKRLEAQAEYYIAKKKMCESIAQYYANKTKGLNNNN